MDLEIDGQRPLDAVHDLEESSVHYWSIASSEHDILFSFGMSGAFVFTD